MRGLLDAVAQEDAIGVLEALAPGERDALRGPIEGIAAELRRVGLLDGSFDLGKISGVDVEFENLELTTEPLADHLAAVQVVGGTARWTTTAAELPIGPVLRDLAAEFGEDFDAEAITTTEELAQETATIATVQVDGRWYVSLFYSVAENARRSAGEPLPAFGEGVTAEGAASPEGAVEALFEAAVDLDVRRLVALTPPGEMAALQDYAPLFLDDADGAIAELRAAGEFSLTVDELQLDGDTDGDRARVAITSLAMSGVVDGDRGSFSWDGECMRIESPDVGVEEQCRGDEPTGPMLFPVPAGLGDLQFALTAVRVDGSWYVSPTGTVLDLLTDVLRGLEEDDVRNIGGFFTSFFPFAGVSSSESFSSD